MERSRRRLLRAAPLLAAAATAPWAFGATRQARACFDDGEGFSHPCGPYEVQQSQFPGFEPWWVRSFEASKLWSSPTNNAVVVGDAELGQYFQVQEPQQWPRLRVWDPRADRIVYIADKTVGPVGAPPWAEHLNGLSGRWIDVDLKIPQNAVAMQADILVRRSLVTAGLRGETRPGYYTILRRVYNETMDSRTIPGLRDSYLLKNVLFTQYFTGDGAAMHYNWWGPPYGFGRPGSHGCLGMMYDDSKFFWEWADLGTPLVIHT
jgi:hypothetical protein